MEQRLQFISKGMCSCDVLFNFKEWAAGIHLRTLNAGSYLSSFLQNTLKSNQVEINTDARTNRTIARLKEPRELFSLSRDISTQQGVRWPIECQVIDEPIHHIEYTPPVPEPYYIVTGRELRPKPVGAELGTMVYDYSPSTSVNYDSPNVNLPLQFSRSVVGGTPATPDTIVSTPFQEIPGHTLQFESRFESGNLAKAVKISDVYYELYLRPDLYTGRHMQWFYFRIQNTRSRCTYRFSIVNMSKPDSLYSCGMRPLLYSVKDAEDNKIGWRRCGENITYFRNNNCDDEPSSYTLTFNTEFPYDDDTVFLAHSYPYTYSTLQDYLMKLQNDPVKSEFSKIRLLCRSLAGNNVYYLTITAPTLADESKKKQAVVITARVHPGETPSSWMMKGFLDYLTSDCSQAKELREKFIFKLVPMLNPDGVIVGNNRCSLTGRDLNRQYRTVIRETYPSIWYTKVMIRRLLDDCGIVMYCDLHAHSRKHNVFIYGCESKRIAERTLKEQVFPLMLHKNAADKFSFENCKFRIQRSKEGTGRVVLWSMGVNNSYTMEASFGGSRLAGHRANTHFSTADLEAMGRHFCDTLLDFCDEDPAKEQLRNKIVSRLFEEGSNADEPINIALSDYSSDDGITTSSSDEEKENFAKSEVCAEILEESSRVNVAAKVVPGKRSSFSKVICRQSTDTIGVWYGRNSIGGGISVQRRALTVTKATLEPPADVNIAPLASEDIESADTSVIQSSSSNNYVVQGNHHSLLRARRMAFKSSEGLQRPAPNSCLTPLNKGYKESGVTKQVNMPPELIVTQAQVYEGQPLSIDIVDSVSLKEINCEENPKLPHNLSAPSFSGGIQVEKPRISRSLSQRGQMASRSFSEPKNRCLSVSTAEISAETSARYSFLWQKLWPGSGLPPSCRPVTDRRDSQSICKKASLNGRDEESSLKSILPLRRKKTSKTKSKKLMDLKEWDGTTAVEDEKIEEDSNVDEENSHLKSTCRRRRRRKLWKVSFQKKNKDEMGKHEDEKGNKSSKEITALCKDTVDKLSKNNQGKDLTQLKKKFSTKSTSLLPMVKDQPCKARVKFKGSSLAVTAVNCAFGMDGTLADESEEGSVSRMEEAGEQQKKKKKKRKKKNLVPQKKGKKVQSELEANK